MSKSLNHAFLRAFSKGQASAGAVPAPHVRAAGPVAPPLERPNHLTGGWRRTEESTAATAAAAARVPAPHLPIGEFSDPATARSPETAEPVLESQQTLVVSDLGSASILFGVPTMVLGPSAPVDVPKREPAGGAAVPTPAAAATAVEPAPAVNEPPAFEETQHDSLHHEALMAPAAASRAPASEPPPNYSAAPQHRTETQYGDGTLRFDRSESIEPASAPTSAAAAAATAVEATSTTAAAPERQEFVSAWEVDRLGWSMVCNKLYESEARYFEQAGRQLKSATGEGLNVLAITSTFRGEGRTTLALLLARCAAAAGVRVAVLDADLDNPQLASSVKVQPVVDWRSLLDDSASLSEAAVHSLEDGITLFPLETDARGETLPLSDPAVTRLIESIAQHFELLIIDAGPLGADLRRQFAAGEHCPINAAVVVRDVRSTAEAEIRDVVERLLKLGVEAVGIAENFTRRG